MPQTKGNTFTAALIDARSDWVDAYRPGIRIRERGRIVSVGDGIAWISGLPSAAIDELLVCDDGSEARVFDLSKNLVGALLLHATDALAAGVIGSFGHEGANRVVSEADVLLVVGCRLNPMDSNWQAPGFIRPSR